MKLLGIIQLTFRESLAKRTFIAFLGISTLIHLLLMFALNLDIVNGADAYMSLFGQEIDQQVDVQDVIYGIEAVIATFLFTFGCILALFATSSLVPSFLEKGNIDLMISKPLSRWQLLTGRFLGANMVVAFNVFYLIGGTWLILSLKAGIWNWGYLMAGVMIMLTFAIGFALMTLLSVMIRSGPFALMITYLVFTLNFLLIARDQIYALLSSSFYGYILDGLYHFLPKTTELGDITRQLVQGIEVTSWLPLFTSMMFGLLMFGLSTVIFSRKNF